MQEFHSLLLMQKVNRNKNKKKTFDYSIRCQMYAFAFKRNFIVTKTLLSFSGVQDSIAYQKNHTYIGIKTQNDTGYIYYKPTSN